MALVGCSRFIDTFRSIVISISENISRHTSFTIRILAQCVNTQNITTKPSHTHKIHYIGCWGRQTTKHTESDRSDAILLDILLISMTCSILTVDSIYIFFLLSPIANDTQNIADWCTFKVISQINQNILGNTEISSCANADAMWIL